VTTPAPPTAVIPPFARERTERPTFRLTPSTVGLLAIAALAWAGVIVYARHMGNGPGTMGISLGEFTAMWALMMTAMMAPAVAPVASLYARTITSERAPRLSLFIGGYLLVWALSGIPTYAVLRLVDHAGANGNTTMRDIAVGVLVAAGGYQLSPLKARCLRHCRSPLAQLLRYGNVKGRGRDLKVALHHAGYCLGCCWALMALFIAFGVMNLWAMLGLATVVLSEKVLRRGEVIGRLAGAACIVLAALVLVSPGVANAVVPSMSPTMKPASGGSMTHM
jgi:predicted metal-binding membrane protein